MSCLLAGCVAHPVDLTGLWGRTICYRHLAEYMRWPSSPADRAPTRDEWAAFLAWRAAVPKTEEAPPAAEAEAQ
jgi:hypothetical protein